MSPELAPLVADFRTARAARRRAGEVYRATDTDEALAALQRAMSREQSSALVLALAVAGEVQ